VSPRQGKPRPKFSLMSANLLLPVWTHFGFETAEKVKLSSSDHPKCYIRPVCHQKVSEKDGNSSNVYSHSKSRHPEVYSWLERRRNAGSMITIFSNFMMSCVIYVLSSAYHCTLMTSWLLKMGARRNECFVGSVCVICSGVIAAPLSWQLSALSSFDCVLLHWSCEV